MQCTINPPSGIMNEQQEQRTEMHLYTKPNESSKHGMRNQRKRTAQWRSVPEERSFFFSIEFIRGSQQSCKASPRFIRFFFVCVCEKASYILLSFKFYFFLVSTLKKDMLIYAIYSASEKRSYSPRKGKEKTHTHTHTLRYIHLFSDLRIFPSVVVVRTKRNYLFDTWNTLDVASKLFILTICKKITTAI